MSTKLSVGIIGCGNIGSLWDETEPDPAFPKTHAYSVFQDEALELRSLCDANPERLKRAADTWKVSRTFGNAEALIATAPDIIGICTPTSVNKLPLIEAAVRSGVKGILCEKPAASDVTTLLKIKSLCEDAGIHLVVNFIRRFDAGLGRVRRMIAEGSLGQPQKVVCHYGKGLLNNGSHILDLLHWFFGNPEEARFLSQISDPWAADPTVNAFLTYQKNLPVFLTAQSSEFYSHFEIDIFLTQGRIRILASGREVEFFRSEADVDFAGYKTLNFKEKSTDGLRATIPGAYAHLGELIRGQAKHNQSPIEASVTNLQVTLQLAH